MTEPINPPTVANPAAWFGVIRGAVNVYANTAEIWSAIRQYAATQNVTWKGGEINMLQAVNTMRSLAAGQRNAGLTLEKARGEDFIGANMIGAAIYSRPTGVREAAPNYHVSFTLTHSRSGVVSQETFRLAYDYTNLPNTVGELRDDVQAYGIGLGDTYGTDVTDVTDLEIQAF